MSAANKTGSVSISVGGKVIGVGIPVGVSAGDDVYLNGHDNSPERTSHLRYFWAEFKSEAMVDVDGTPGMLTVIQSGATGVVSTPWALAIKAECKCPRAGKHEPLFVYMMNEQHPTTPAGP